MAKSVKFRPRKPAALKLRDRLARIERRKRMEAARWSTAPETQRQIERMHRSGPRLFLEFLTETGLRNDCAGDIRDRLAEWSERLAAWTAYCPEALEEIGATRMVPWRPLLVPKDIPGGEP